MSYIIYYHYECFVRDTIVLSSFQRFPVDGRKRLEYATCGSVLQKKKNRGKNLPFSTISGYVLKWPQPRLKVRIFGTRKCLIKRVTVYMITFFLQMKKAVKYRSTFALKGGAMKKAFTIYTTQTHQRNSRHHCQIHCNPPCPGRTRSKIADPESPATDLMMC